MFYSIDKYNTIFITIHFFIFFMVLKIFLLLVIVKKYNIFFTIASDFSTFYEKSKNRKNVLAILLKKVNVFLKREKYFVNYCLRKIS